jgi:hypothetical protein
MIEHSCRQGVVPPEFRENDHGRQQKLKGVQDRTRISLSEDYEVRYWCEKLSVTADELRAAVKRVGNSAKAVENEIRG